MPAHPVGDVFGLGTFVTQRSLPIAALLIHRAHLSGSHWVREEFTATRLHAGPDGVYWWGPYDRVVDLERRSGLQVLGLLDYSNTWGYGDHGTMPHDDMARLSADFSRYAYTVARHFRGRIQYWQLWNEPNLPVYWHPAPDPDDYALLLDGAYRAVKRANPRARIVLAGTNGIDLPYLSAVAARTSSFDVVAVHPYRGEPEENLLAQVRALQAFGKPVWFSEIGWPAGEGCDGCPEESDQARYLVRFYVTAVAAGVQRIFWYDFRDDDHSPNPRELHFGLLRRDLTAKQAFISYAFLAHTLQGATFVAAERFGSGGIYVLRFQRNGTPLKIMWNTGSTAQNVAIPWHSKSAVVVGMDGAVLGHLPAKDRSVTWPLQPDGNPVYVLDRVPVYRVPVLQALPPVPTVTSVAIAQAHRQPVRHRKSRSIRPAPHRSQRVTRSRTARRPHLQPQPPHDTRHRIQRGPTPEPSPAPIEVALPPAPIPTIRLPSPTPRPSPTATPTPQPSAPAEATPLSKSPPLPQVTPSSTVTPSPIPIP